MTPGASEQGHIEEAIEAIADLERQAQAAISPHQRWIETVTDRLGRPRTVYFVLLFAGVWIGTNVGLVQTHHTAFDPPPFAWLQGLVSLSGLLMATLILTTANRVAQIDTQRDRLALQINLLNERRTGKLIRMLDEQRRDNPGPSDAPRPRGAAIERAHRHARSRARDRRAHALNVELRAVPRLRFALRTALSSRVERVGAESRDSRNHRAWWRAAIATLGRCPSTPRLGAPLGMTGGMRCRSGGQGACARLGKGVNAMQIRAFGQSELSRTKTDKADAALIARFGKAMQPNACEAPTPAERRLRQLVRRRRRAYRSAHPRNRSPRGTGHRKHREVDPRYDRDAREPNRRAGSR